MDGLRVDSMLALGRWQRGLEDPPLLNLGTSVDLTIRKLA